ncbi:peptide deformylase [Candidatus Daviesbacteria bacterium RIFCSPLOWO2_02_FULL_41_8]|uniref:Peptide deformylase n=2 Tax=Candidatus Daviesiibacteriota TaxID=1752718 RepID=A0A1F5NHX3_9BACT|nr:MAG: peptide deformylase [Candidatus Daviesbacteria bacterium RIFCSPHIGHO2_02_FULL_41_10]OGE77259.1 MAG: peptide deformylase [Candidatus Daviesbacteria bacterium RIFCSPLOWO2_02_FULL_41_8]
MLSVIKAPDAKLRVKTKPVKKINQTLKDTLKEMVKLTKTFKDPEGVGLAATQVGLSESFFVAKNGEEFMPVINPKIISMGKRTKLYFEGCLSVPNMWGEVRRSTSIKVSYQDNTGKTVTIPLKGVLAWIFQHEVDHLNGVLFSDRVLEQKGKFYKFTGKDKVGTDVYQEVTL